MTRKGHASQEEGAGMAALESRLQKLKEKRR